MNLRHRRGPSKLSSLFGTKSPSGEGGELIGHRVGPPPSVVSSSSRRVNKVTSAAAAGTTTEHPRVSPNICPFLLKLWPKTPSAGQHTMGTGHVPLPLVGLEADKVAMTPRPTTIPTDEIGLEVRRIAATPRPRSAVELDRSGSLTTRRKTWQQRAKTRQTVCSGVIATKLPIAVDTETYSPRSKKLWYERLAATTTAGKQKIIVEMASRCRSATPGSPL